ncbi:MAG: GAF domain-containing protein [Anaerolineae bacterium]|nr:GAF domain-containing protein [Anaerolineae bacterium]
MSSGSPAQAVRQRLDELVARAVQRIAEADLPGMSVLAQPVVQQSVHNLYAALLDAWERGTPKLLVDVAGQQAETRRRQGIEDAELAQVASLLTHTLEDELSAQKLTDKQRTEVTPLLAALSAAFGSRINAFELRKGGDDMQNRQEFDYERILHQLETSAQVSRQLTAALDLDDLLLQVVELIKSRFDYYHVHVYLLDPESGDLIMREGTGEVGRQLRARGHRIPLGTGLVGGVGKTGIASLVGDVSQNPQWLPNDLLPGTRSELTVSLPIGDRILGVLDVQSNQVGGLTNADLQLMESLGQQIAVAVQNATLFRETRAVSLISRAVSSGLGRDEVFGAVSRELKAVLEFDYMTLATFYEITGRVELIGVEDQSGGDIPLEEGVQLALDQCVPGIAMGENRVLIVPNLADEAFATFIDAEILLKNGMRSLLSVPLAAQGRVVGAINLVSRQERAFTAADAHLMEQISGQLASALTNAMVFENIQQMVSARTAEIAIFRTMAENASEAIALTNVEQMITYANPAFYRTYGYNPQCDDLSRRSLTSFIETEDEGALSDEVRDHVLRGEDWHKDLIHLRQDGTHFAGDATVFGIHDEANNLVAFAAIIHDVTAERKIMEISRAASSTPELDRLAPLVLVKIAEGTDIDRIVLILYDEINAGGPQSMSIIAVYDPEMGGQLVANERLTTAQSPFSVLVYYERSSIFVADVATDERLTENGRTLLLDHGLLSMLALPIWVRDKIVGMVGIDWRKRVDLSKEQIDLYQTMVNQVSTAVENARLVSQQQYELETTLDRRVREAATAIEVGQAIGTAPQLEELFSRVVTLITERFGYYHAHVYQVDPHHNDLEMMAGYGEPGRIMKEHGHRIPMGRGLVGTAAQTGQPVRVGDVSRQENWLPNELLPETRSEIAVPIKLSNRVLGVLDVQSAQLNGLTEDDELLMLGLCGQIATAINNTQLVEQLQTAQMAAQERAYQLELSAGVSQELASTLDLEILLSQVVELIRDGFDYYHVHIYLVDKETDTLVMMEGTGEPGSIMKQRGHRIPIGKGLVGKAAQTGVPVWVSDVSQDEAWLSNPLLPETRSEIAVPLKMGQSLVGVLDVQDSQVGGLTVSDLALLEGLGGQIAVAVQNALTFKNIEAEIESRTREVRRFQSLAENATDAILIVDLESRITFANNACYQLYGYDRQSQAMDRQSMARLWPPEARDLMDQAVGQALDGGWRGRVSQVCRSGKRITVSMTLFALRDAQNNPSAIGVSARDMTTDELIDQVSHVIGTVGSLPELAVELLRVVIQGVSIDRGHFVIYEGTGADGPQTAHLLAGYDEKAPDVVEMDVSTDFDQHTIHRYLYESCHALVCNPGEAHEAKMEQVCYELDREIFVAFPLIIQNQVGGMLLFDRERSDQPFSEAEIDFFNTITQQISLVAANFILRQERQRETQRELDRRRQETLTTTEVAQTIAAATAQNELFQRVVTLVKERFNYYHAHLYEYVPERHELVLVAGYGEPGRIMVERGHRLVVGGRGLNSTAVITRSPVLVSDTRQDPNWLPNELLPETRSELAVPILMGDRVLGVLDVQQNAVGGLTQADQNLLLNLCGQIASAMENTRLLEEMQTSLRRTSLLLNLSTALSSLTDVQAIADAMAEQLMAISSIERCWVAICIWYDKQDVPETARVYALRDRDSAFKGGVVIDTTFTLSHYPMLVKQVMVNRGALVIDDVGSDERLSDRERQLMQSDGAVSAVVIPMVAGERVLGFFTLADRQPYVFSAADIELYLGVSNQGAISLSNALALSQTREALEDETRLYESSRAIATATTLNALTGAIIEQIAATHVDRCEIMLFEQRGSRTSINVAGAWCNAGQIPPSGTRYRPETYPLSALIERLDVQGTRLVIDAEFADLPEPVRASLVERGVKALVLVPLIAGEEYIGFLSIERHLSSTFNPESLRLYGTIASQSAVALRNVQLLQISQNQLDDLQTSYNEVSRLAETVRQLSSPVIQIWQDVLVLPLVGTIDSQRALRVMEDLLTGITRFQAEQVIIDVTGVPVMDVAVVNHLMQTIKAATLLGARCMLVGIDSEKAQTIVQLGLDWKGIRTYSNLRAGIQAALGELGYTISPLEPSAEEETL